MKKYLILIFCVLLALTLFSFSASPTAVRVGKRRVDASEYAYYLNYSRLNLEMAGGVEPTDEQLLQQAREQALRLITNAELLRLCCDDLDLGLTKEEKAALKDSKEELVSSFGGTAGYLEYLRGNLLTDRLYDKLQENGYYYNHLYDYVSENDEYGVADEQQLRQFYSDGYAVASWIFLPADYVSEDGRSAQDVASELARRISGGEETFEQVRDRIGGGETVVSLGDPPSDEAVQTCLKLSEGETVGPYGLSDGWYILRRGAADMMWFEENRDEVEAAAADKAFNDYLTDALSTVSVVTEKVCQKIDFTNLEQYVK